MTLSSKMPSFLPRAVVGAVDAVGAGAASIPVQASAPASTAPTASAPLPSTHPRTAAVLQPSQPAAPMVAAPSPRPAAMTPSPWPAAMTKATPTPVAASVAAASVVEVPEEWGKIEEFGAQVAHLRDAIPRVFIATESSKGFKDLGWTKGLWTHRGTSEQKPTLKLVFAFAVESRAMRVEYKVGAPEQAPPVCVSLNATHGLGSDEHDGALNATSPTPLASKYTHVGPFEIHPGTPCSSCKWSAWTGKGRDRSKPACGEEYTVIGLEEEWGPIAVTFRSTAIAPLRKFKQIATHRWMQAKAVVTKQAPQLGALPSQFFGAVRVATTLVEKAGVVPYSVPTFELLPLSISDELFCNATDPVFLGVLKNIRTQLQSLDGMLDAGDAGDAESDVDTSFDPEKFSEGDAQWEG